MKVKVKENVIEVLSNDIFLYGISKPLKIRSTENKAAYLCFAFYSMLSFDPYSLQLFTAARWH